MKSSLPKLAAVALAAGLLLTKSNTFANGTPYVMSTGDYLEQFGDVANWTDNFAAGIGAGPWGGVITNATGTIPDGVRLTTATTNFQATTTSGGVQKPGVGANPAGTITLLTTGTTDNTTSDAIDLFLDFTGRTAGTLSFDWQVVFNSTGNRAGSLRVYSSVDGTTWTELTAAAVLNFVNNVAGSGTISAVSLPAAFNGSATARLRFYYCNGTGGTTGSRPKIALDNVAVTSTGGAVAPNVTGITPSSITTNAGSAASFIVTATGSSPLYYFWYKETGSSTNLIAGATTSALSFPGVLGGDTASYQAVVSNATTLTSTSAVVSLTVTGDPRITVQPASVAGLLDGIAQFNVSVAATAPTYRWYFADSSSNITAQVSNGARPSGSVVSGAATTSLTVSNLQYADVTNFVVVVSNQFGSATSVVASILSVTNRGMLAYWDFNGSEFTNSAASIANPAPYIGSGTASAVGSANVPGTSPFSGSVDPIDGIGFALNNHLPNFSWGTSQYPTNGNPANNKTGGLQFNVSALGAKNLTVTYDSRPSATASVYQRLQYTTNGGTTWIDYPSSTSFGIGHGTTYSPFGYSLVGFPGVDNNPNFAIRIVSEMQHTATYGITANTNYVGANNTYGTTGTLTYDIVNISGEAITNANTPPSITSSPDTNTSENVALTLNFTVGDTESGAGAVTLSAASLNNTVNPSFSFGGSGASRTMTITPNSIPDSFDAAPILVRATDPNGDSTATWFILTVSAVNLPPTNSLTAVKATNTIAATPVAIPFTVGDDHTAVGSLSYSVASDNQTLVPNANIVVSGTAPNKTVTITPAAGQLGVADVYVTVNDNDGTFPKSTTATIALMVRPNTNVIAIDSFSYDSSGALDVISSNTWKHLSGPFAQMQFSSGVVTVNTFDNTENLQTALLGAPYSTASGAVLYSSFIVNMADATRMPLAAGTYFAIFNDGSGNTANVEGRVMIGTNGAAPGNYRLGIANLGSVSTNAAMVPQDLVQNSNYVVVTKLVVSNGFSTIWISPLDDSSPSVTDTTPVPPGSLFNMSQFELRESGANGGSISVSKVRVGTTFDSVFPKPQIQTIGGKTVVTWSDPTITVQSATSVFGPYSDLTGATSPYTNSSPAATQFYRFKP